MKQLTVNNRVCRLITYVISACAILIGILLLVNRVRYGIDLTDETWYVAEPYIVSQNAIPFVDNWTQAPGFTLPVALLFHLFVSFTHGTEGIVLFSRLLYVFWLITVLLIAFYFLGHSFSGTCYIALFPLMFPGLNLYDINYNSLGIIYLLLVLVLMLFTEEKHGNKKLMFTSFMAGFILARTIIGAPCTILAWIILIFLCMMQKQWAKLRSFLLGTIAAAVAVVGWCCLKGGIKDFIKGLWIWLNDSAYFKVVAKHTLANDLTYLASFCKPFLLSLLISFLFRKFFYKYTKMIYCYLAVLFLWGLKSAFMIPSGYNSIKALVKYLWFIPFVVLLAVKMNSFQKKIVINICIFNVIYFVIYLFASFSNIYGFIAREYWLYIPSVFSMVLLLHMVKDNIGVAYLGWYAGILLMGFLTVKIAYEDVYRDVSIDCQNAVVSSGIWKGCYTTAERAQAVETLEHYIRSVTSEGDDILFLDQVPFGYLMSNGKACTPTASDPMLYSYNVNNEEIMFDYFLYHNKIPNKIIYIDFGRDETLSIDAVWNFNAFVVDNYFLKDVYATENYTGNEYETADEKKAAFKVKVYEVCNKDRTLKNIVSYFSQ